MEAYIRGLEPEQFHLDLQAVELELDRMLTPADGGESVEARAERLAAVLDVPDPEPTPIERGRARARELRHESLVRRMRRDNPAKLEEWARRDRQMEELIAAADAEGPAEERFRRRIARGLSSPWQDDATPEERVRALAARPLPTDPLCTPAREGATWTICDWLGWEEFADGVPCQGCGQRYFDRAMENEAERRQEGRAVEPYDQWQARIQPLDLAARTGVPGAPPRLRGQAPFVQPRPVAL